MIKIQIQESKTIRPKYLRVIADVRYWEDATVNNQTDTDGSLMPLRSANSWMPVIDLETGVIQDWPQGTTADIHYKVCDAGEYFLLDAERKVIAKWDGFYVPDDLLCPKENGYGDYIIMQVNGEGKIDGWDGSIDGDGWSSNDQD